MAQADYIVSNGTGAAVRSDLNGQLAAIVSNNSGATAPATTYAYQWWADTTTNTLKLRNSANSAWIEIMQLDGTLTMEDGTAALPGLAFRDDLDTGIFRAGTNQLGISSAGVERVEFGSSEVVFNDAGNNYDFRVEGDTNANLLFVDASADAVGIGTSSPEVKFSVVGTAAEPPSSGTTANSLLQLKSQTLNTELNIGLHTVTGNYGAYIQASDNNLAVPYGLHLQPNGGNVGIGTTSPSENLHVSGAGSQVIRCGTTDTSGIAVGVLRASYLGGGGGTQSIVDLRAGDGYAFLTTTTNTPVVFGTNTTERARIDTSGRLLVGTSTARDKLFNGTTSVNIPQLQSEKAGAGLSNRFLLTGNNGTAPANPAAEFILARSYGTALNSYTAVTSADSHLGAISFQGADGTEFVEAASIQCFTDAASGANDMPGRLVFSTTADGASSPTERMRIGNNGDSALYTQNTGGTLLNLQTAASAGTSAALITGTHSASGVLTGTVSLRVWSNGNIQNTNKSYTGISDIKLKENIADANSQWDDIKSLQVRNYNLKEGQTHRQIGLIAQEVEPISPGLVYETPDRDEDGNDLGTVTKSVQYSVLYMKAVKALQEAMERIEQLEAKVAALESA